MPLQTLRRAAEAGPAVLGESRFDVRGWQTRTLLDEQIIGTVDDVLVDEQGVPRWLVVGRDTRTRIALPVGICRLGAESAVVWIAGFHARALEEVPRLRDEVPTRAEEGLLIVALESVLAGHAGGDLAPRVETGEERSPAHRLVSLGSGGEYAVPSGESDPRGWCVLERRGEEIGTVEELIVDTDALRVAYLLCRSSAGDRLPRRFLLDAAAVRLLASPQAVLLRADAERGGAIIAYAGEQSLRALEQATSPDSAFYEESWFDPRRCFGAAG